jgi:chromatin modification-related protein VID21
MTALFQGPRPLPPGMVFMLPGTPAEARKRATDHFWTSGEDILLKSLCDRYPGNWHLICDSFNSSRYQTIEKRSPWDCAERWKFKWGHSNSLAHNQSSDMPPPASPAIDSPQITTRRRMASISSNRAPSVAPTPVSTNTNDVGKKRRRHMLMYETVRKAAKKREAAARANGMHKGWY